MACEIASTSWSSVNPIPPMYFSYSNTQRKKRIQCVYELHDLFYPAILNLFRSLYKFFVKQIQSKVLRHPTVDSDSFWMWLLWGQSASLNLAMLSSCGWGALTQQNAVLSSAHFDHAQIVLLNADEGASHAPQIQRSSTKLTSAISAHYRLTKDSSQI